MGAAFTALAIAEARANAVGAVRVTCGEERLEIELLRVAWHAAGFAPGAVAESIRVEVPYAAVRALFRRGPALCLSIDPSACAPYNRFSLARFTDEPVAALARAYQARLRARLAGWIAPLPLGILVAAAAPADLASGPLGLASLAAVVALATWLALRGLMRALTWGGPAADRRRDALEAELSRRMGFSAPAPAPVRVSGSASAPARASAPVPAPVAATASAAASAPAPADALAPRPRALVPIALVAAGVVATMALVQRFAVPRAPAPLPEIARVAPIARAGAQRWADLDPAALAPIEPALPRCLCERADSPLWRGGLPRLSLLPSSGADDAGGAMEPVDGEYDFELAVVNNGAEPLRDVHVLLTFARREGGRRTGITERGLFREGLLRPGHAVKWHVEAPGTEVKVEPGVVGPLEGAAAPPEAFFALTRARYRSVRIHAAMMLAYLRDPRAIEALRDLGAPAAAEERTFARIRRAAGEVIVCDAVAEGERLRACVFNAGVVARRGAALRELVGDADPSQGAAPRSWSIEATLPVHEGIQLEVPLQGDRLPEELEVVTAE